MKIKQKVIVSFESALTTSGSDKEYLSPIYMYICSRDDSSSVVKGNAE